MAGEDILLRVKLDTSEADRKLRGMLSGGGGGGGAPGGNSAGVGQGAAARAGANRLARGGGGGRLGSMAGAGGGMGLGAKAGLGLIGGALAVAAMAPGKEAMFGGAKDWIYEKMFGAENIGAGQAPMASRSSVMSMFGQAVGMGAMSADDPIIQQMFDIQQKFGAGAAAAGQQMIKGKLAGPVAEAGADAWLGGMKHFVTEFIPEIAEAIGKAVANALTPG